MGLQWIWLTKELAWGKRNKKSKKNKIKTITFVPPTTKLFFFFFYRIPVFTVILKF